MQIDADDGDQPLELTDAQEITGDVGFEEDQQNDDAQDGEGDDAGAAVEIGFGDEVEGDDDPTPLVRKLREQVRTLQRQVKQTRSTPANDEDAEPIIPEEPDLEALDYDQDRFKEQNRAREKAIRDHAAWTVRQGERDAARKRFEQEQAKTVEQQVRALGVTDFEEKRDAVRDRLSDAQLAVLLNGAENPAKLLYALGRSESRLEELASIDNLARFAARMGQMERDVKVSKRQAPAPESKVRGATAGYSSSALQKQIEKLEKDFDAGKITDRTEIRRLRAQMGQAA